MCVKVILKTVLVCASEFVYCSVIPKSLSLKQKKYRKKRLRDFVEYTRKGMGGFWAEGG